MSACIVALSAAVSLAGPTAYAGSPVGVGTAVAGPQAAALAPSVPRTVVAVGDVLGIRLTWRAPTRGQVSHYRVWIDGAEASSSQVVPADVGEWFISTPDYGVPHTVSITAVDDQGGESRPVTSSAVSALGPGAVTTVPTATASPVQVSLSPSRSSSIPVTRFRGVPEDATGLWVLVDATAASATTVALWSSGPAPAKPQLSLSDSTRSVRSVFVPVSNGRLLLKAGAAAATATLRASGWTVEQEVGTSGDRPGGTLSTLAPTDVFSSSVNASTSPWVRVGGVAGVPSSGVSAALVSLRVRGADAAVVSTSSQAGGGGVAAVAGTPGHQVSNQVLIPLDRRGRFRIISSAPGQVIATVTGWVGSPGSAGTAPPGAEGARGGVWTRAVTPTVLSRRTVRAGRQFTAATTAAGASQASAALVEVTPTTSGADSSLALSSSEPLVDGTPSPVTTIAVRPGIAEGTPVWVPLSATGEFVVHNTAPTGSVAVTIRVLAYGVGEVLVNPDLDVLTGATAAAYGPLQTYADGSGTLTLDAGQPAPAVGAILASGPTADNPAGLLVGVTATSAGPGGTTDVSTRPSSLVEAVRRGSVQTPLLFGATTEPRPGVQDGRGDRQANRVAFGKTYEISKRFSRNYDYSNPNGDAHAKVEGVGTLTAAGAVSIDIGWTGVSGEATVDLDGRIHGTFSADGRIDWSERVPLGSYQFRWFVFQIGPVPVVVRPGIDLDLVTEGHLYGAMTVEAEHDAHVTLGLRLDDGLEVINDLSLGQPTLRVTRTEATLYADVGLAPALTLDFYGVGTLAAGLDLRVNASRDSDACDVVMSGTIDATLGVSLDVLGPDIDKDWSGQLLDRELTRLALPLELAPEACFPWTGIVEWNDTTTRRLHFSSWDPGEVNIKRETSTARLRWWKSDGEGRFTGQGESHSTNQGAYECANGAPVLDATDHVIPAYTVPRATYYFPRWDADQGRWTGTGYWFFLGAPDGVGTGSRTHCGDREPIEPSIGAGPVIDPYVEAVQELAPAEGATTFEYSMDTTARQTCATYGDPCSEHNDALDLSITGSGHLAVRLTRLPDADGDGLPDAVDPTPQRVSPLTLPPATNP